VSWGTEIDVRSRGRRGKERELVGRSCTRHLEELVGGSCSVLLEGWVVDI
jgi:hypothetical protein